MKKSFAALAVALTFAAVPSFAQYDDDETSTSSPAYEESESEYSDESSDDSEESSESAQASADDEEDASPARMGAATRAETFVSVPLRYGAHLGLGIAGLNIVPEGEDEIYDGWLGEAVALGGTVRYYFLPYLAAAAELNFSIRAVSQTLESHYDWYYGEDVSTEATFNHMMLDLPIMARFEPTQKAYVEAGFQFGFTVFSYYDETATSAYRGEVVDTQVLGVKDWPTVTFVPAFLIGGGMMLPMGEKSILDIGVRFTQDLVAIQEAGGPHLWTIQLSCGYIF